MANATAKVNKKFVHAADAKWFKDSSETLSSATNHYTGAMMGWDTTGYLAKFDDTQSMVFAGLVRGQQGDPLILPAGTAGDGTIDLEICTPRFFHLAIASIAVTDRGKKVYASYDQTGVLVNTGTYGNFVGHVVGVVSSGIALVEACYDGIAGHQRYGVSRTMAATGSQTLTKLDLNKTIMLPNTAAHALTLPAVADTQNGDRFYFVKTSSNAAAVTITGNASENIDGSNTYAAIDAQWDCATLVSYGTAWAIESRDIA